VTKDVIRQLFSQFGEVVNVILKNSSISPEKQCGHGFIQFPSSIEGTKAALQATAIIHQVIINNVLYDCALSYSLQFPKARSPQATAKGPNPYANKQNRVDSGMSGMTPFSYHSGAPSSISSSSMSSGFPSSMQIPSLLYTSQKREEINESPFKSSLSCSTFSSSSSSTFSSSSSSSSLFQPSTTEFSRLRSVSPLSSPTMRSSSITSLSPTSRLSSIDSTYSSPSSPAAVTATDEMLMRSFKSMDLFGTNSCVGRNTEKFIVNSTPTFKYGGINSTVNNGNDYSNTPLMMKNDEMLYSLF
jgi:mating pheromone-induced death protein 2